MFEAFLLMAMAFVGAIVTSVGVLVAAFLIRDALSKRLKPPV